MNKIRDNLSSSIVHLRRVIEGNDKFCAELDKEVERATALVCDSVDIVRRQMILDQADALRKLRAQVTEITQQVRQKFLVCEQLYTRISVESSIDQSEEAVVRWLTEGAPAEDDVWMAMVIELIATGSPGTLLHGIVLPHLRKTEVECYKTLCE